MPSINKNCQDCSLHKKARTVCMVGEGSDEADIIIVGSYPNEIADKRGEPIVGDSALVLKSALRKNGLLGKVYITNQIKCSPPKGYEITNDDIKACRKYLDEEIANIKPSYVVTMGVNPTKALFRGKAKINQVHGELIENEKVPYIGMPIFDPGYTLRDLSKLPGFENDIKRLARAQRGEEEDSSVKWNVVRRGNLDKFIAEFTRADEFSFDLETSGLFQYGGARYITAVGIGLPDMTWIIPGFMHPKFMKYCKSPFVHGDALKRLVQLLVYIANKTDKQGYAQNGKFDNIWLSQMFGVKFHLDFDTMLAHHTLDENNPHDLTSMCRTFLHEPEYDIPLKWKLGMHTKPTLNFKYCAGDCTYTFRLTKIFKGMLDESKSLHRLFYKLVMPAARAMEEIEQNGLTVDLKRMDEVGSDLVFEKIELRRKLNELAGRKINWNSPPQICKVLFEDLKLPSTIKTPKGNPSTSEEAILDLMGTHEVADLLIRYREVAKFLSTYIEGFKSFMVGDQLYISYKLHGTVTGRYSSRLHSIPRDGSIRSLITAPPGWKFVQGDIATAELRTVADMSGDPEMRRCFQEGVDIHWRTLMNFLITSNSPEYLTQMRATVKKHTGKDYSIRQCADIMLDMGQDTCIQIWKGWKEGRKKAKAINFGYVYGMYPKKFINTAKTKYGWEPTLPEAEDARNNYFMLYSGVEAWHERQKKLAKVNGYVRSMSGRLRRLPAISSKDRGARSEAERQSVNAPVQGFIGDYKAMVMIEIHEALDHEKLKVVGEHHDAVLMLVRDNCEDEMLPKVLSILRTPKLLKRLGIRLSIPMDGELEVGNWGAGVQYHA